MRQLVPTTPSTKQAYYHQLITTLKQAEEATQWGNPVSARQHILRAMRLVNDNLDKY